MKRAAVFFLITTIIFINSPFSYAEQPAETEKPWERFALNLGGFITTLDTSFRFGTFIGLEVDLEKALGMDDSLSIFRADGLYRFGKTRRHRLDVSWTAYHRSGSKIIQQEIPIEPNPIPPGTGIETKFNYDIIQMKYSYSFFQDDRMDLGVGIGLYAMPIETEIRDTSTGQQFVAEDFVAPLPVFNLRGDFAVSPKLFIKLNLDFFYIEYDKFTGGLTDARLAVEYNIWKHFGIGLSYDTFDASLEAEEGTDYPGIDWVGKIELEHSGLLLYAKIYF